MKQEDLNNYFSTSWRSRLDQYEYSGWALLDKVKPNEMIVDVGCGFNEFSKHLPNLIGIDPANDNAHYKIPIEYYQPEVKFDVAFCLGSINFGGEIDIINQIAHVVSLLKPKAKIFWRCNPGLADHNNEECKDIDFYSWSIAKHIEFAELFGFKLRIVCWDTNNRIYAEWAR